MATAKKLPSGSWRCQVYSHTEETAQPDGTIKKKRIYKSFTCDDPSPKGKRKCEAEAAKWAMDKERRSTSENTLTFSAALDKYITERSMVLSPASVRKYRAMERNNFDEIKDIKLSKLNQSILQSFINQKAMKMSAKSVRDINGIVTAVLKRYAPEITIPVTLPKKTRPDIYVPTDSDIKRLIASIKGTDMEVPVMLGAFGALRRGEISALNKSDLEGNIIHVTKTKVLNDAGDWVVKAPKSYAGDRYVEVPQFVADAIKTLPGDGIELTPNKITSRFEHILKSAGLPHFRFHDLRHYNASIQHALGIPDAYIMLSNGWGNDRVLKEVYRHTLSDARKKMSSIAIEHFDTMQHEMQHAKK